MHYICHSLTLKSNWINDSLFVSLTGFEMMIGEPLGAEKKNREAVMMMALET